VVIDDALGSGKEPEAIAALEGTIAQFDVYTLWWWCHFRYLLCVDDV